MPPKKVWRGISMLRGARGGNVATMAALTAPLIVAIGAISIDAASLYLQKREAQAVADLAAIAGANNLGDARRAAERLLADNGYARFASVEAGGTQTDEQRNGAGDDEGLTVELGRYASDPGLAVSQRFLAGVEPANAVRVTLRMRGRRHFAAGLVRPLTVAVRAVAATAPQASFSVGSRLVRLDGGVLNGLLGALLGTQVSLSVMDYQALAQADISLLGMFDGLASEVGLTALTYRELLESDVRVGDIAAAVARLPGLTAAARLAAGRLATDARKVHQGSIRLSRLVDAGPEGRRRVGSASAGDPATVSALTVLAAAAALGSGSNQIRVELGAGLPGIAATRLDLAVGEPPAGSGWLAIGPYGTTVQTAQTRLLLTAQIGGSGVLAGATVTLPVYLEIARAEARLAALACAGPSGSGSVVTVEAKPGIAALRIARIDVDRLVDFSRAPNPSRAAIVNTSLISVTGSAAFESGNIGFAPLTFDQGDIAGGRVRQVSTRNATETLTASLVRDLDLDVRILGLGIGLPEAVRAALAATFSQVAPPLDNALFTVLETLGVRVGEADVRVHGVRCGRSVLVQ